jgi:hypothetical protein
MDKDLPPCASVIHRLMDSPPLVLGQSTSVTLVFTVCRKSALLVFLSVLCFIYPLASLFPFATSLSLVATHILAWCNNNVVRSRCRLFLPATRYHIVPLIVHIETLV